MLRRRGHFRRHLQAQQRLRRIVPGRTCDGLDPGTAHRRAYRAAEFLLAWHLIGLTMLPGSQEVGERLAVRLGSQFAQRGLGMFQRLALRAKCGIAQARPSVFEGRTAAESATALVALRAARSARAGSTRTPVVAARFELVVAGTARATGAVLAVAELAATTRRSRLGLLHAGSIIAPHGDHALGRGPGRLGGRSGRHVRICGCRLRIGYTVRAGLGGRRRRGHLS